MGDFRDFIFVYSLPGEAERLIKSLFEWLDSADESGLDVSEDVWTLIDCSVDDVVVRKGGY